MGIRKILLFVFLILAASCEQPEVREDVSSTEEALFFECGNGVRYPTTEADFAILYDRRGFYAAGNHLGRDIAYPEGTPVRSIACGRIVFYTSASSYGRLVAVVEHRLSRPVTVTNGNGETVTVQVFLSIQGHLRRNSARNLSGLDTGLSLHDEIPQGIILGYIDHDDFNGHGREHDHFGIRLQSEAQAKVTEASIMGHSRFWFRGYDTGERLRGYFADPAIFMQELMEAHPVLWHPPGTLLVNSEDSTQRWLVGTGDTIHPVDEAYLIRERLWGREVEVSPAELNCYREAPALFPGTWLMELVRFDGDPAVYESHRYRLSPDRRAFISWEAFLSWGWTDADIVRLPASYRDSFLSSTTDRGFRRMRPGSLVKARGESEVAIISDGHRLPFFNWETFIAMGYDPADIVEVDPSVIDDVAYPRGGMITSDLARLCRAPSCSGSRCAGAGTAGGGGVEPSSDDAGTSVPSPDAGMPPVPSSDRDGDGQPDAGDCAPDDPTSYAGASELCDNRDNNCDGIPDNGIPDRMESTICGPVTRSCRLGYWRAISGRDPEPEVCNGGDDDCDGTVDEGVCAPPPPSTDSDLVRIRLTSAAQAMCPTGWRIRLWLGSAPEESPRGGALEHRVTRRSGYSSITLWCDERSPPWYAFSSADAHALGSGIFAELSMGGVDLRSSTRICEDPAAPGSGYRPIIRWDPAARGSCP